VSRVLTISSPSGGTFFSSKNMARSIEMYHFFWFVIS
jgi:hypothetical protein